MKKGDIYFVDLKSKKGSEQGGRRPVLVIRAGNSKEKTIVASMTTSEKRKLPVHISLHQNDTGLKKNSLLLLEQLIPMDKRDLKKKIGRIQSKEKWGEIESAIKISLGL